MCPLPSLSCYSSVMACSPQRPHTVTAGHLGPLIDSLCIPQAASGLPNHPPTLHVLISHLTSAAPIAQNFQGKMNLGHLSRKEGAAMTTTRVLIQPLACHLISLSDLLSLSPQAEEEDTERQSLSSNSPCTKRLQHPPGSNHPMSFRCTTCLL